MADARIGGASLHVGVNADKLVAGLNKAEGKVRDFGKKTKDVWDKIGERFGGGGGGFIAKTLGAGFFGGLAGSMAIRLFDSIRDVTRELVSGTAKWKNELELTQRAWALNVKQMDRALKLRDAMTAAMPAGEMAGRLREDVTDAEGRMARAQKVANLLRAQLVDLKGVTGASASAWLSFGLEEKTAKLEAALRATEAHIDSFGDRAAEAKEKLDKLLNPDLDDAKLKELNALIDSLRDKSVGKKEDPLAKFAGMTRLPEARALTADIEKRDTHKAIKELTTEFEEMAEALDKGGKSAEWLKFKEVRDMAAGGRDFIPGMKGLLTAFEMLEKGRVDAPAKEFLKTLQLQRMALDMSTNEAKLLELHLGGASQELIRAAGAEAAILQAVEDKKNAKSFEPKFAAAMEAGSREAHSLELKHRFGTQGDPNKGVSLWDINVALLKMAATLQKIEAKPKAGVF